MSQAGSCAREILADFSALSSLMNSTSSVQSLLTGANAIASHGRLNGEVGGDCETRIKLALGDAIHQQTGFAYLAVPEVEGAPN